MIFNELNEQMRQRHKNFSPSVDYAAMFNITDSEARLIAGRANHYDDFIRIWENETWWKEG